MDETGLMVMLDGPSGGGTTDILYNIYSQPPRVSLHYENETSQEVYGIERVNVGRCED